MSNRYHEAFSERVEINISPLIDMVFLLLIFFVVTTAFIEETGVEVKKPTATSARVLEKKSILLAVTQEGKIYYGGREIGLNGVRGLIFRLLKEEQRPVIIIADENSKTGIVVDVIDECKLAGAKNVSIAAQRER